MVGKSTKDEGGDSLVQRDPVMEAVGARIRKVRMAAGLSQRNLAKAAGVSQAYVYIMEGGGSNMTVAVAAKVAAACGVPLASLFTAEGEGEAAAGPAMKAVAAELAKLRKYLEGRRNRDEELLGEVEKRLAAHHDILAGVEKRRIGKN